MNDFYITEATQFSEGSFENVARRILKTQRKLGALKGLSVSTMSLSDSRKDRLKKAGLFSVAAITGAALAGAGIHAAKGSKVKFPKFGKGKATKEDFLDEDYLMEAPGAYNARRTAGATQRSLASTNANRAARRAKQVAANRARVSGKPSQRKRPGSGLSGANSQYAHSARKVQYDKGRAELGLAKTPSSINGNLPASLRAKKAAEFKGEHKRIMAAGAKAIAKNGGGKGDALTKRGINGKLVGAGLAAAGAAGVAGYYAAGHNKQSIVIEAKYAYGTKLFQVYKATQEEIAEHVDKEILKVLTRTVASLKSATDWTVKESVSEAFIQRAALSEMLIEEALTSQFEEDALLEEYEAYIFEEEEDEEEDDEDLAEAYYFEEDDDELVEAYIFEEDEEEDDEEEEEDDEDLAEAYYFED